MAEGRTSAGVPVYNVALPLLRREMGDAVPLRLIEVPRTPPLDQRLHDRRAVGR
jgi:hypothetical protein